MKDDLKFHKDVIEIGKRIHSRGWIAANDGNISVKIAEDRILTTATGVHKGYLSLEDLILVDPAGKVLSGNKKPSSELKMHLECYRQRNDISAVLHAHPTTCVALSISDYQFDDYVLPELFFTLGKIVIADYAPPSTVKVPQSISKLILTHNAIILRKHGTLTVGMDIYEAYNFLERLEHSTEILLKAKMFGNTTTLKEHEISELHSIKKELEL